MESNIAGSVLGRSAVPSRGQTAGWLWACRLAGLAVSAQIFFAGEGLATLATAYAVSGICCWRNGFHRPVLKHGPRSLTCVRVFGCQTLTRNESERVGSCYFLTCGTTDRPWLAIGLSKSRYVGTRKMVNYA